MTIIRVNTHLWAVLLGMATAFWWSTWMAAALEAGRKAPSERALPSWCRFLAVLGPVTMGAVVTMAGWWPWQ